MHKKIPILIFIFSFTGSLIFTDTHAQNITVICANGYINTSLIHGSPPVSGIPTYSYQPNGLVQFHFHATGNWGTNQLTYRFYDSGCNYTRQSYYGSIWPNYFPPDTPNFTLRAVEVSPNSYNFEAINTDTGEIVQIGSLPGNFGADSILSTGFLYYTGYPGYSTYSEISVFTPAVPVKDPNYQPTPTKTPVLIVPGVLGTEISQSNTPDETLLWADISRMVNPLNNDSFMDPLGFKTEDLTPLVSNLNITDVIRKKIKTIGQQELTLYDYSAGLINLMTLPEIGYTEGQNLFTFPYDWRYGVSDDIVNQLEGQIQYILTQTEAGRAAGKVNVIAHSTGGLVVKKYVKDNPNTHGIGKAVFVGVPNLGAPKAFKVLINGDNFNIIGLNGEEMKKIGQNMPVVYDLSPSPQYDGIVGKFLQVRDPFVSLLAGEDVDYNTAVQHFSAQNLINDLALTNSQNLHTPSFDNYDIRSNGVDVYNIIGCKAGTFGKFIENIQADGSSVYDFPKMTTGDGTVPLLSAQTVIATSSNVFFAPKADHGKMLSSDGIRQQIVNLITGSTLNTNGKILGHDDVQAHPEKCQIKGEQIKIKSPVAISVIETDNGSNNYAGLADDGSIQNNIPGADYEIWGDHKYVFLPTDEGQQYDINLKGTGSGTFTLQDESIDNGNTIQTQVFSNMPVTTALTGRLTLNSSGNAVLELDKDGNGVFEQNIPPSAVVDPNQTQDLTSPVTSLTISGTQGQPRFYRSDVGISLAAIDPVIIGKVNQTSGVLKTYYNLDNQGYQDYINTISVKTEGQHTIKFFSTDKTGNNESEQTRGFTIDKTAPEIATQYNTNSNDFQFTATDNLDLNLNPVCTGADCQVNDLAGNKTILTFKKNNLLGGKSLSLKTIKYNSASNPLVDNLLLVYLTKSSGLVKLFSQSELIRQAQVSNVNYISKTNQSIITDWQKGSRPVTSSQQGIKFLQVYTDKGTIKIAIK